MWLRVMVITFEDQFVIMLFNIETIVLGDLVLGKRQLTISRETLVDKTGFEAEESGI